MSKRFQYLARPLCVCRRANAEKNSVGSKATNADAMRRCCRLSDIQYRLLYETPRTREHATMPVCDPRGSTAVGSVAFVVHGDMAHKQDSKAVIVSAIFCASFQSDVAGDEAAQSLGARCSPFKWSASARPRDRHVWRSGLLAVVSGLEGIWVRSMLVQLQSGGGLNLDEALNCAHLCFPALLTTAAITTRRVSERANRPLGKHLGDLLLLLTIRYRPKTVSRHASHANSTQSSWRVSAMLPDGICGYTQ
ncbi:hypothetical protein KC327_g18 [Hortaea werneckii]|nr:hypothetical protein KC327_g18 [Hortaea werneckii]